MAPKHPIKPKTQTSTGAIVYAPQTGEIEIIYPPFMLYPSTPIRTSSNVSQCRNNHSLVFQ